MLHNSRQVGDLNTSPKNSAHARLVGRGRPEHLHPVCHGNQVLDDDHFVFHNNALWHGPPPLPPDKAAVQVSFDALLARADRVIVIAAGSPPSQTPRPISAGSGIEVD